MQETSFAEEQDDAVTDSEKRASKMISTSIFPVLNRYSSQQKK